MSRGSPGRFPGPLLVAFLCLPTAAVGQYTLAAPSGEEVTFSEADVRRMLDTTRVLRTNLADDPRILYFLGNGPEMPADRPAGAFPWNAVDVLADSVATVQTPGNLREADRAYANYAVRRMGDVRSDPDVSCDSIMTREVGAVSSFVDGWVVARTLFGGPPFAPLDELAFAREVGLLPGLIAHHGDRQLGGCLAVWTEGHEKEIRAYETWRAEAFADAASARPTGSSLPGSVWKNHGGSRAWASSRARPAGPEPTEWLSASTTP